MYKTTGKDFPIVQLLKSKENHSLSYNKTVTETKNESLPFYSANQRSWVHHYEPLYFASD